MSLDDIIHSQKKGAIALFNPPSPFLLDERVFPPLCLADIGAVLESNGYHVDLYDLAFDSSNPKDWKDEVLRAARKPYAAFLVSATTPQFMYADAIRRFIRQMKPNSHIIIGGAHPSLVSQLRRTKIHEWVNINQSLKNDSDTLKRMLYEFDPNFAPLEKFDLIYEGDGESAVHKVVNPEFCSAFIEKEGSKWFSAPLIKDLNTLGIPARHLYQMETYNKYSIAGKPAMSVMTQRGCPFKCEFCSGRYGDMYRQVRYRSSEHVIRELEHMQKVHGVTAFMFYDDEFNLNKERTIELCNAIIYLRETRGVSYVWRAFIKSELLVRTPEIADMMKKAGCVELCTGVESGSEFILSYVIHKNTSPELNLQAREIVKKAGLRYKAFTMVGHAGETEKDAMDTLDWILKAKPDDFDVTICTPYPGAPIYDRAEHFEDKIFVYDNSFLESGDTLRDPRDKKTILKIGDKKYDPKTGEARQVKLFFEKPDYSQVQSFYKGVPGEYISLVWTPCISKEKFVELREYIDNTARDKLGLPKIARPFGIDQSMGAPPSYLFSKP